MSDNTIHLAFAVNDSYVDPLSVALTSLLENVSEKNFIIHLLYTELSRSSRERIEHFRWVFPRCDIHWLAIDTARFATLPLHIEHTSIETWYRFLLPVLLPDLAKVLYLDADIVALKSVLPLWRTDISDYCLAGVEDLQIQREGYKIELGLLQDDLYVNAGVLLFNLDMIRKQGLTDDLFALVQEKGKALKYQDQDALNIVMRHKILKLNEQWNFASSNARRRKDHLREACIAHFTGTRKPWLKKCRNPFRDAWKRYERQYQKIKNKKLKVGLLIDEFFGGAGTAYGGYGFLARHYIAKYVPNQHIQIDVLLGRGKRYLSTRHDRVDGTDLYRLPKWRLLARRFLRKKNYDVYFSIELTTDYVLETEPDTSKRLVLWIQDPRPKGAWENVIDTMKTIKDRCFYNQKIYDLVHHLNQNDRVHFITQGESLNPLARELYDLPETTVIQEVPNPVELDWDFQFDIRKKKKSVVFLGRLEAQKRAWLYCEIAKRMPEYEFYVLGQFFRYREDNERMLAPYLESTPANLHFSGHSDGNDKKRCLKEARLLLNTSIWEGIPISWLEALSYGTLLVSCLERENLVSRFGSYVGRIDGDGFDGVDRFIPAIRRLMEDDELFEQKARAAIDYVRANHDQKNITPVLREILRNQAIVPRSSY